MIYKVVFADDRYDFAAIEKLTDKVNNLLQEGWVLQGGISLTCNSHYSEFIASQAMVKHLTHPTNNMK